MKCNKVQEALQRGQSTNETQPVAAIIEIGDECGTEKILFEGENAQEIIQGLEQYQDLDCMCRMAQSMGTKDDARIASKLSDFLSSPYSIDDFDNFVFPFSIGCIKCTGWAKGTENIKLLKQTYDAS